MTTILERTAESRPMDLLDSLFARTVGPDGGLLADDAKVEVPVGQIRAVVRMLSERIAAPVRPLGRTILAGAIGGVALTLGAEAVAHMLLS